ncbi:multiple inositol polyphosphate phosphatase 1-like isoform X2 [Pararge aegeria]|uniref:multiple inositol polyphosphate phosphatase 1-like isoform X2 n=1 Tax=Pararge aegeria TaxID=116150 RepID=UPI0019CFF3E6|nr:multiple inositol polyphosphate phosphatase 1-like isoform X2 [Pararge aegeria]
MSVTPALCMLLSLVSIGSTFCKECYWNRKCQYDYFSTVTPYDSVRGDLRDQPKDDGCEVISVWSIHRHGNRNPGPDVTRNIRELQYKIKQLLDSEHSPASRRSNNCSQDMYDLMNWSWNSTMDNSAEYLTGIGYEELFDLGRRLYYGHDEFLKSVDKVYFKATNEQRTITSLAAFVRGMSVAQGNFSSGIDPPSEIDYLLRPYKNCERYTEEVKNGPKLADELAAYDSSAEFLAIRDRVQSKMFVDYQMTSTDVNTLYELCRFERSWSEKLRSPWCSFFTDQDLIVLEYRDDVRHFYRNGYASEINVKLGGLPLKDLYENFVNATEGDKKTLVSYFTHDTMMEMVYCALGLYKDPEPPRGFTRDANRLWRTTQFSAFASNLMAILTRCVESGVQTFRVQILINEKTTPLCPEEGCTWQQFLENFQGYSKANLDVCA